VTNDKQTNMSACFPNPTLRTLRRTYVRTHTQPIYTGAQGRLDNAWFNSVFKVLYKVYLSPVGTELENGLSPPVDPVGDGTVLSIGLKPPVNPAGAGAKRGIYMIREACPPNGVSLSS